jgi:predicted phosphodiesterase
MMFLFYHHFRFTQNLGRSLGGGRAIPPEATHIAAELIAPDFEAREVLLQPLPSERIAHPPRPSICFAVMSDLHLSGKSGRIRRALRLAKDADCVLLAGDMTNDGAPNQFELFRQCIEEELPNVPVLAVAGNHDFPLNPLPMINVGVERCDLFQTWLLERASRMDVDCAWHACGAYSAAFKGIDIVGLNAVSHWRRFVFPHGDQVRWLGSHLDSHPDAKHIVLCHAPLAAHNPGRNPDDAPYLSRDQAIQQIIDASHSVILVSGHTHISLNDAKGCVEYDSGRKNLYINDSSVAPTALRTPEFLTDHEWVDGAVLRLCIGEETVEISSQSLSSGKKIARGYYRYQVENKAREVHR